MKINSLTKKILFTAGIVSFIRLGNFIPIPDVDQRYLVNILNQNATLKNFFNSDTLILSVFSLGILPNINASIMMQLLISAIPPLERLQKEEGEAGRRQIKQYTRFLTLMFAIVESFSIVFALKPILFNWSLLLAFKIGLTLVTGSMIVLWLSDLITENGIGNGSSIIITLNILSALPSTLNSTIKSSSTLSLAITLIGFILLITGIVYVQEAIKVLPLISAKQLTLKQGEAVDESLATLPLRLNQGGIMPLIFSSTFLSFITLGTNYLFTLNIIPNQLLQPKAISLLYTGLNFVFIIIFSVFYSNLILNPKEISKDLNKMAVSIKNVRPGKETASFLKKTLTRLSLIGALFLAFLVALPNLRTSIGFGATSLLILVGVSVDTTRQIQTLLISEKYEID
nr:SecY-type transporter protein [Meringosphaera mediterranea]